jgi:hypothetical protein
MIVLLVLALFVVVPAAAAFLAETSLLPRTALDVGVPVIYREARISMHPVSDASDVEPSPRGEFYYYSLVNYLRITDVLDDGRIIAIARNNKRLCVCPNDFGLRKARLTERLVHRRRFPRFSISASDFAPSPFPLFGMVLLRHLLR